MKSTQVTLRRLFISQTSGATSSPATGQNGSTSNTESKVEYDNDSKSLLDCISQEQIETQLIHGNQDSQRNASVESCSKRSPGSAFGTSNDFREASVSASTTHTHRSSTNVGQSSIRSQHGATAPSRMGGHHQSANRFATNMVGSRFGSRSRCSGGGPSLFDMNGVLSKGYRDVKSFDSCRFFQKLEEKMCKKKQRTQQKLQQSQSPKSDNDSIASDLSSPMDLGDFSPSTATLLVEGLMSKAAAPQTSSSTVKQQ
mmetsp:Transcript_339/g.1234  ORF Transcript_339/g.1234 Transcript_339/m.1234 type:complete len:256 (-) Transcript_339:2566-3333(-)